MECRITIVTFDKKVGSSLLSAFRGAIAPLFPEENIYHNHEGKSLMYRYPLFQYKLIEGRISIVGINEGAASVENHFHCGQSLTLRLYDKDMELRVSNKMTYYYIPESFEKSENYYFLRGWLPLNQENYIKYLNAESISEKISLLDNILSANILSLFSGFGYYSENRSVARIVEIVSSDTLKYKDNEMLSFNVRFKCNAALPEFCGLGKGASRGYGTIFKSHPKSKR